MHGFFVLFVSALIFGGMVVATAIKNGQVKRAPRRDRSVPRKTAPPKSTRLPGKAAKERPADQTGVIYNADWARQGGLSVVDALDDPREAAAVIVLRLASLPGPIQEPLKHQLVSAMMAQFGVTETEGEGLYSFGRMAINQLEDFDRALDDLVRPIHESLTQSESAEFIGFLGQIALIDGPVSHAQQDLIHRTGQLLGLHLS